MTQAIAMRQRNNQAPDRSAVRPFRVTVRNQNSPNCADASTRPSGRTREAARNALLAAGVQVGEFFHLGPNGPAPGLNPERRTSRSRAEFKDPDGHDWILQEITSRLSGRMEPAPTSFALATDWSSVLRRAAMAHGKHEKRMGQAEANWPDWYAEHMVREQTGQELPE